MGLFDSSSRLATKEYGDLYRDRANRLTSEVRELINEGRAEEAEGRVRQLIALQEKFVGDRHPEYAAGLTMLAEILTAKEELGDAETVLQRSLEIRKKALGEKHPVYAESLDLLGRLMLRFEDFEGAEPLLQKALDVRRVAMGVDHQDYATSLVAMADLHRLKNELDSAEKLLRDAIVIQRKTLGEDHSEVAKSLFVLTEVMQACGRFDEAETLLRQAIELLKQSVGETHPHYLTGIGSLARLLQKEGKLEEAEPIWRLILDTKKQSLGERHPEYAAIQSQVAQILEKKGDIKGAEVLLRQVSETFRISLGERHPDYATSLNQLATTLQHGGDLAGAEPFLRQVLAIRKDVLGARHPDYITSLINLARLVQKRGDSTWAKMLLKEAVELRHAVCGEDHPDYAQALVALADVLGQQGDAVKAEALLSEAIEIRKNAFGTEHPSYAASLSALAALVRKRGDFEGAEDLLIRALKSRKAALGEFHPDYATNLGNLAWLLQRKGDRKGAENLLAEALEIRRQLFGEAHPDYCQSRDRLEKLRRDGQLVAAEAHAPATPTPRAYSGITAVDSYDEPRISADDSELAPGLELRADFSHSSVLPPVVDPVPDDHPRELRNLNPPLHPVSEPSNHPDFDHSALFGGEILASMEMHKEEATLLPEDEAFGSECKDGLMDEHAEAVTGDMDKEEGPASDAFAELLASEASAPQSHWALHESAPVAELPAEVEFSHPDTATFSEDSFLPEESRISSGHESAIEAVTTPFDHGPETPRQEIEALLLDTFQVPPAEELSASFEFAPSDSLGVDTDAGLEYAAATGEPAPETLLPVADAFESNDRLTPALSLLSSGAPVGPAETTARSFSMTQNSSHLSTELTALSDRFSDIGERLLAAARQLHAPGVPPADELIEAVSVSRHEFMSLRDRALQLAETLEIHAPASEHLQSLQDITGLLDQVAEAELRRSKGEDTRRRAVAVLDRVLTLSHASGGDFEPLRQAHEQALALRASISDGGWGNPHTDAEKLAEGEHHFADLLSLIEDRDELSDELWATLHESVTNAFGKALAAAAARSKLSLPASNAQS